MIILMQNILNKNILMHVLKRIYKMFAYSYVNKEKNVGKATTNYYFFQQNSCTLYNLLSENLLYTEHTL